MLFYQNWDEDQSSCMTALAECYCRCSSFWLFNVGRYVKGNNLCSVDQKNSFLQLWVTFQIMTSVLPVYRESVPSCLRLQEGYFSFQFPGITSLHIIIVLWFIIRTHRLSLIRETLSVVTPIIFVMGTVSFKKFWLWEEMGDEKDVNSLSSVWNPAPFRIMNVMFVS